MERDARDTTKQNQGHQSSSTSLNKFSVTPKLWRRDNRAQDSVEDGSRTKKNLDRSQQQEFGDTELPEDSKSISNMLENASRASEETSQSALPSVKPNAEGRYECPLCSKDYAESRGMQKHWRTHPVCMREGHRVDRAEFEVERGKIACKECGALVSTKGMKSHDSQHPKTRTSGDVVYGRTASSPGSGNFRPSPKEISSSAKRSKSPMIETRVDGTDSVKKMIGKKRRRAEDDSDDDWRPPPRDF
ncbi:uncharacterized protein LY89DRAFT_269255 [Mollisia scopiformis]|uniref:C2H2-type domain-containing protein n=1 Tax=Mollisia scopiformis TaxID=149040 RepID=A0A132BCH9_MOLSC|nr:uncharacterized protein LY89DRAFT_269255 [Mollisia scopiformis]KUJ10096.1 hypothetical protein LY89DRAFT_269255 [Mollisia scopiformis]